MARLYCFVTYILMPLTSQVNNEDLTSATHNRALQVLRQTPAVVALAVYRDESQVREEDILDIFSVELVKRPGKGLGLSIVGKKNDVGIYISDIVKGGVAEADGRLMQGDQILAVNSEDMRQSTQEYAAAVLKVSPESKYRNINTLEHGFFTHINCSRFADCRNMDFFANGQLICII